MNTELKAREAAAFQTLNLAIEDLLAIYKLDPYEGRQTGFMMLRHFVQELHGLDSYDRIMNPTPLSVADSEDPRDPKVGNR